MASAWRRSMPIDSNCLDCGDFAGRMRLRGAALRASARAQRAGSGGERGAARTTKKANCDAPSRACPRRACARWPPWPRRSGSAPAARASAPGPPARGLLLLLLLLSWLVLLLLLLLLLLLPSARPRPPGPAGAGAPSSRCVAFVKGSLARCARLAGLKRKRGERRERLGRETEVWRNTFARERGARLRAWGGC